jgi:hypothetical protein
VHYVDVRESRVLVVSHLLSHRVPVTGVVELLSQQPRSLLNLRKLLLNLIALFVALEYLLAQQLGFFLHLNDCVIHLMIVHDRHLLVLVDHFVEEAILLFKLVSFLVQLVDVGEEAVVLFLCFDKRRDNFVDVCDAGGVLDCFECFFNDASVADVLVQQLLFL